MVALADCLYWLVINDRTQQDTMHLTSFLLPWLLLALAIAVGFAARLIPLRSKAGIITLSALGAFMLLFAVLSNLFTAKDRDHLERYKEQALQAEDWKYRHLDELTLILAQFKPPSEADQALLKKLISYGWLGNNSKLLSAQQAHEARERLRANYNPVKPMLIKGVPTNVDEHIVKLALRQVGFTLVPYQADEEPYTQVNIIYYGRDMTPLEVKLAALTLMRAGVELKAIKPFPKDTQGNLRAIKVDWNKYYDSRKILDVADIETVEQFK